MGDLRTAALTAANGDITWFCTPRFDAPSLFGALLDCRRGGRWTIRPDAWADPEPGASLASRQMYLPDTNVLITRFFAETGVVEVTDFMPLGTDGPTLVRAVSCVRGEVPVSTVIDPRPDYGRRPAEITAVEGGAMIAGADHGSWLLRASVPMAVAAPGAAGGPDAPTIRWSGTLRVGDSAHFCLETALGPVQPRPYSDVEYTDAFDATVGYWRRWLAKSRYIGRWREMVHRSALLLKLLTYSPTSRTKSGRAI